MFHNWNIDTLKIVINYVNIIMLNMKQAGKYEHLLVIYSK